MKKITLIIIFLIFTLISNAQNNFSKLVIKVGNTTLHCKTSSNNKSIWVRNAKNNLYRSKSTLDSDFHSRAIKIDKTFHLKQHQLIKKLFSKKRLESFKSKKTRLAVVYYITDGKATEVDFNMPSNTDLKPFEIVEIEKTIKNKLNFQYTANKYKSANFIVISLVLHLDKY